MNKKTFFLAWFLTFILLSGVVLISSSRTVFGTPQSELEDARNELNDLQDKVDEADSMIESAETKKAELEKAIEEMDTELNAAMSEYNTLIDQQKSLNSEIDATQLELDEAIEKEETQYEDMKLRIQYMYENGSQSYLEILVSSENIVDFINSAAYITELTTYDRQMLKSYQTTKQTIEDNKLKLENDKAKLDVLVADSKEQLDAINSMIDEKTAQINAYKEEISRIEGNREIFEDDIEAQTAVIAALEKKAQEEEAKNNSSGTSSGTTSSSGNSSGNQNTSSGSSSGNQNTSSGSSSFLWPVPASRTVTSEYGYRHHPSTGKYHFHSGIDIAAPTGTSIVATSGGVVTSAGWNSSMGNYVMISHGNGLVSIYMHASSLCVSTGESVSAGQLIALVGSTGDSTGPHLHFGVRLNGSYVSPWDYL